MRIMIEEDLPQEKSRPHVPLLNHPGSTSSGPLWPSYRKCEARQQLWSVSTSHWRVGTLSSPMWKLLFQREMCHVNIANICLLTTLSLVSRSVASSSSAIVSTSVYNQFINPDRTEMIRHRATRGWWRRRWHQGLRWFGSCRAGAS